MTNQTPSQTRLDVSAATKLVAVAGNPNSGKTTLFNALTGLRHKVGNYPGVTVEKREGLMSGHPHVRLLDLPGTYSLSARSPDEEIAREVLLGHVLDTKQPDAVLVVVDAGNLERNLYLASQIIELGFPVVVACNMIDSLEPSGHALDLQTLSHRLDVPVVGTVGHRGRGIAELRAAILQACGAQTRRPVERAWSLPQPVESEVAEVAAVMTTSGYVKPSASRAAALLLLTEDQPPARNHLPTAIRSCLSEARTRLARDPAIDLPLNVTSARYEWLGTIVADCLTRPGSRRTSMTDRLDHILTHRVWGLASFALMMAVMFYSIFAMAAPLMDMIETVVEALQNAATRAMGPGVLRDLIRDGVVAGVGNIIVFFPQICILSLFIALLEDSGYMARAAFLMDRLMSRVGLHGKSFIPLLSSHACAIPGILATRTIENPKDRLATILVAPLMSCSARLPVYIVLIAACLPGSAWAKAGTLFGMYTLGIIAALVMATVFKKTLLQGPAPAFIMELPPYRRPRAIPVLRVMWDRSRQFLVRAGTVILASTVVLWAMMTYPTDPARGTTFDAQRAEVVERQPPDAADQLASLDAQEAAANLQGSLAGRLGRVIEPIIRPLGYDWRIGIGLISSLAAREVFVSTMGIVYSVGEADSESTPLREQLRTAAWPDGRRVLTTPAAIGLMIFYVLACQCISTIAVVRRETNSWRWPAFMFTYMTAHAYAGALITFQVGSLLGFGS